MKSQPKRTFHTASEPEIKAGEVSDVYFDRTVEILRAKGLNKHVKAEIRLKSFPQPDWTFGVLAGIEEASGLLEGLRHACQLGFARGDERERRRIERFGSGARTLEVPRASLPWTPCTPCRRDSPPWNSN